MAGSLAAYRDGVLTLRMDDGKRKVFRNSDRDAEAGGFGYALLDVYPALHLFVVTKAGVDTGTTTVVDARTGRTTDFGYGFPLISPSGRWILVDETSDPSGDPSAFKLIDAATPGSKSLWSSKTDPTTLSSRGFRFVRWDDDSHARFELGRGKSPVLLVRADDGRWHYDLADDTDETAAPASETAPMPEARSKR